MDDLALIESLWDRGEWAEGDRLHESFLGRSGRLVQFNPNQHPRDAYGQFAAKLGELGHGDRAVTSGGVEVTRGRGGSYHVKAPRARGLDVRSKHSDPREAAAAALTLDQSEREPTRIGGRLHRKGAPLSRREAAGLKSGSPVVTGGGEYGRLVGVQRAKRAGDDRALIELDPRDPTRSSTPHTRRVSIDTLSGAVPVESDPEGSHLSPHAESPGQIDAAVRSGLGQALGHVAAGGGGDAIHFIHDVTGAVQSAPHPHPRVAMARRAQAELRQRGAQVRSEVERIEREVNREIDLLTRSGIVPSPRGALAR